MFFPLFLYQASVTHKAKKWTQKKWYDESSSPYIIACVSASVWITPRKPCFRRNDNWTKIAWKKECQGVNYVIQMYKILVEMRLAFIMLIIFILIGLYSIWSCWHFPQFCMCMCKVDWIWKKNKKKKQKRIKVYEENVHKILHIHNGKYGKFERKVRIKRYSSWSHGIRKNEWTHTFFSSCLCSVFFCFILTSLFFYSSSS